MIYLVLALLIIIIIGGWYFLVYTPDKKNNKNIKKSPKIKNRKFNRKNQT